MNELDLIARGRASEIFTRGTFVFHLSISDASSSPKYTVNRDLLDQLVQLAGDLSATAEVGRHPPRWPFAVKGVIEPLGVEPDEEVIAARNIKIDQSFEDLLMSLQAARLEEGSRISMTLSKATQKNVDPLRRAESFTSAQPAAIMKNLLGSWRSSWRLSQRCGKSVLHREVALLITKADVREELDRLCSHLDAASALLSQGGVIGRKLDFLCQN